MTLLLVKQLNSSLVYYMDLIIVIVYISFLAYMNYGSVRIVTGDVSQGIVKGMERISNYTLTRHFNRIKNKVY